MEGLAEALAILPRGWAVSKTTESPSALPSLWPEGMLSTPSLLSADRRTRVRVLVEEHCQCSAARGSSCLWEVQGSSPLAAPRLARLESQPKSRAQRSLQARSVQAL